MKRYLLDTSVYSQPLRKRAVEAALLRWSNIGDAACAVSAVSVGEVEFGLALENRAERRRKYEVLLEGRLEVLPTTMEVWLEFARRKARQQILGETVADLDLLIAATALVHRLTVATLNVTDFARIEGISWEDWSK
jgi:predicted nucleic acid-binding protein